MLRLLLSKDWIAGRNKILSCIASDVANGLPGRVLIVPELISYDVERRLCKAAGNTVSRYAEVLSFPRLATRVAARVGNTAASCLDNGGRMIAMAAATHQLHSKIKAYASVETKPEFLKELVDAVDEFKRCCITSQDLMAASKMTDGTLSVKLEELALILDAYDAICAQGRRDPRDQMTWCLEQLEEDSFAREHTFYIDGFPDFTRQHLAILEHLIKESPSVTISMNCDSIETDNLAFEKAGDTAKQLLRCAKNAGIPVEIEAVESRTDAMMLLYDSLFQGKLPESEELHNRVRAVCADSIHVEVLSAADRVMELVQSGCRYRDISIVCADMNQYQSVMELNFRRYGIPLYQSGREDILQKTVISTVLSALDAALGGFEQSAVLRYLKSLLSPLDTDTCDQVENYVITWGIRYNGFLKSWDGHPEGLGKDWNDQATKLLETLNEARQMAISPLAKLQQNFKRATNLSQQVQALYDFLEEISFVEKLEKLSAQMEEAGQLREVQILNQIWEILLSALEQMYDMLGQTVWEPEMFIRLLTILLAQYQVGTIPPALDAVTFGSVSAMRCQEAKHLLVLGASEGALPGYGGSKGLLTDQERVALRQMGVPLTGGAMEGLQAEFAEIYGLFCGATESVYISYPGGEGSYLYRRIAKVAGGEQTIKESLGAAGVDMRESGAYLARWQDVKTAKALGVEKWYYDTKNRMEYSVGKVSEDAVKKLYGSQLNLSASQINQFAECRLSYFLKYGLRAKERKEITIDAAEFGTYVHDVLEHTAKEVMARGGFETVSLEETLEIAKKESEAYAGQRFSQVDSQRVSYLFERNWNELVLILEELWCELKDAKFRPEAFELNFSNEDGDMPAISIDGAAIPTFLRGKVDRMDIWEQGGKHYFRVVDYKTGKKSLDYCDIYNGVGLQMLLYLFALRRNGEKVVGNSPVAAGVQYFTAGSPVISADSCLAKEKADLKRRANWKRSGLLLNNAQVIEAMNPGENMYRVCCKLSPDGELSGDLADSGQFELLEQYIFALLRNMIDEIAAGSVQANPYTRGSSHNACRYCPYGSICHQKDVPERRDYKTISAQEFWADVEKEVNRNG
ncbi:MAG: hypothetical protein E7454_01920 [Ruminococcaceae bacterium]|nr:hypothetical protein [Oscillospiraceae bacterium]